MTNPLTSPRDHRSWSSRAVRACVLGLAALAASPGCGSSPTPVAADRATAAASDAATPSDGITLTPEGMKAGGIQVEAATTESRAGYFETPAVIQLDETRTARVGALAEGVVVGADAQVGTRVTQGQQLASIHAEMVHEAWADYRRALAERRRASTQLAFYKQAEGRAARLLVMKAVSEQEAERAQADRVAAEESLVIAESEVKRALDGLEHLGIKADSSTTDDPSDAIPVRAAYGGTVLERLVTAGTAVTVGTPLYVVSDLSRLWAVAEIDESRLTGLAVGRSAELSVAAYPGRVFAARIVAIGDSVQPETRRVTARLEVDNTDGSLKPQMYATVRLTTGDTAQVVVVPASAVQKIEQQPVVFVEKTPGHFTSRSVVPGMERDNTVEIRDGLAAGERVATAGTFLLKSKVIEGGQPQ